MANKVSANKDWYTAQELAGLPGMPETYSAVIRWAKKNLALSRGKLRGKGLEYAFKCLPTETQAHLTQEAVDGVLACLPDTLLPTATTGAPSKRTRTALAVQGSRLPATATATTAASTALATQQPSLTPLLPSAYQTSTQRDVGLARQAVLRAVQRLQAQAGVSERRAMQALLVQGAAGRLTGDVATAMLTLACDARGRGRSSQQQHAQGLNAMPSLRTLERWMERARLASTSDASGDAPDNLAPRLPLPDADMKPWMVLALELYRRPQKPTVASVLKDMTAAWPEFSRRWVQRDLAKAHSRTPSEQAVARLAEHLPLPSYDRLARFFRQDMSRTDLLAGRELGSALRSKKFYQHRSHSGMNPADEVHADGWCTHALVPHPTTGEYVTAEIWHFTDVATRYTTRFAFGLSESGEVIQQGLKFFIAELGVPAILQTDSTGSVKNKDFEFDPVSSLSARLGLTVVHPETVGNSQANGIAENYNTRLDRASRALTTYMHPNRMDSLAFKQVRKFTSDMVKAAARGDTAARDSARAAAQRVGKGILFESWQDMIDFYEKVRVEGNNTPHSAHKKITDPATGKTRHQTPQECLDEFRVNGWEPVALDEAALVEHFYPHLRRTVTRETVMAYKKQRYYHASLGAYEGTEVQVAVDPMDGSQVWIKDMQHRLICVAKFVEATGYRSQSMYEASLEKRMNAQIRRKEQQIEAIQERMDPARAPLDVDAQMVPGLTHQPPAQVFALPVTLQAQVAAAAPVAPAPAPEPTTNYSDPRDLAMYLHGDRVAREEAQPSAAPISAQDERDALAKLLGYWDESDAADGGDTKEKGVRKSN